MQGRSANDCAEAVEVDGVDGEFRAPECYPDHVAFDRHCGCPSVHRESTGGWDWCRVDYWSRGHHRFVPGVRPIVFANGMKGMPNKPDAANPAIALRLAVEDQWRRVADLERWPDERKWRSR